MTLNEIELRGRDIAKDARETREALEALPADLEDARKKADPGKIRIAKEREKNLTAELLTRSAEAVRNLRTLREEVSQTLHPLRDEADAAERAAQADLDRLRAEFAQAEKAAIERLTEAGRAAEIIRRDIVGAANHLAELENEMQSALTASAAAV